MTFSIVIMVGRGYFLPTHVHEASYFIMVDLLLYRIKKRPPGTIQVDADINSTISKLYFRFTNRGGSLKCVIISYKFIDPRIFFGLSKVFKRTILYIYGM